MGGLSKKAYRIYKADLYVDVDLYLDLDLDLDLDVVLDVVVVAVVFVYDERRHGAVQDHDSDSDYV
jgi:hypothetical protein